MHNRQTSVMLYVTMHNLHLGSFIILVLQFIFLPSNLYWKLCNFVSLVLVKYNSIKLDHKSSDACLS